MQVDAVEERAADAAHVAFDLQRVAFAGVAGVAEVAAGARVHGGDQHEAGGKGGGVEGTRDGDRALLERLPEDFQAAAIELGQLVEEEDAVVGERDFAGRGRAAAADHAGIADGVMR